MREVVVGAIPLHIIAFIDRRDASNVAGEFLLQSEVQQILFGNEPMGTTGAFYRLLGRAGVKSSALPLRHSSVGAGLLTQEEWGALIALVYDALHTGVRAFTLVPIGAVGKAIACFGATAESEALLSALGLPRPAEWSSGDSGADQDGSMEGEGAGRREGMMGDDVEEEDGDEEEEEGEEDGGDEEGCGESRDGNEDDSDSAGGNRDGDAGGDSNSDGSNGNGGGDSGGSHASRSRSHNGNTTDEEPEPLNLDTGISHRRLAPITITPQLESQLAAFERFRRSTINLRRSGKAAAATTTKEDARCILHFLAWVHHRKSVALPTFSLFLSQSLGAVTQEFIEEKSISCGYARICKLVGSLVAAARFAHAMHHKANTSEDVSSAPIAQLIALHKQCCSESRSEAKFNVAQPPKAWLSWADCQRARARSEHAVTICDGSDANEKLMLVRAACLLRLLTGLPPDRVGVCRCAHLVAPFFQHQSHCIPYP